MASKNTVVLSFSGDEAKLTDAMGKVGDAAKEMGSKVGSASTDMQSTGRSVDGLAESAGTGERRFQGLSDVIVGTGDVMTGFREGDIVGMAQGFADIAGGLEGFLIPVLGTLVTFMRTQLVTAMSFVAAHPLLLALGLLAAAFVVLWLNSEKFREIVIGVFNAVSGFVRTVFGAAIQWIIDRWNGMVDWFRGLPGRIGAALGSLGDFIGSAFKTGLNVAIEFLNWGIRRINDLIYGVNILNPFENIPYIPQVARLHSGGIVPGSPGQEVLTLLQAGERVTAAGQTATGGGQVAVVFTGNTDTVFASAFQELVRNGTIQISAG